MKRIDITGLNRDLRERGKQIRLLTQERDKLAASLEQEMVKTEVMTLEIKHLRKQLKQYQEAFKKYIKYDETLKNKLNQLTREDERWTMKH